MDAPTRSSTFCRGPIWPAARRFVSQPWSLPPLTTLSHHPYGELRFAPVLDRLAAILPPPRIHRHRYHGAFAPNAPLRSLITARAHQDNAAAAQNSVPDLPLPKPSVANNPAPQPPNTGSSRPSPWAALLARIYEVFPLICPACGTALTFIAFLTDPDPITRILAHIGEPASPPLIHPARGPPQTELQMGPGGGEAKEAAQECFPDDLDQTPPFDPAEPEPIPEGDFDQTRDG